ncbi:MAG: glycosyl hydrolase [Bacteroidota bacterium]
MLPILRGAVFVHSSKDFAMCNIKTTPGMIRVNFFILLAAFLISNPPLLFATSPNSAMRYDTSFYGKVRWREIGPFRAGRSIAVTGHRDQPNTFYFGATGGGIWKTEDGGNKWINVSDGFLKVGIVGALAVAESDPNVIYAGTGESCIRGNAMPGEGIYKSVDAGKSWQFSGLSSGQTISKIRINPKNENLVYAAVFGHVFGSNPERGVYRSKNGGKDWEKILYKDEKTGAVDLEIDPMNPRIIYAALWEAYRNPWTFSSGGPGSGLWKSTDEGDTWTDISNNKGLPKGVKGRIGIAASGAKSGRVWALVEAKEGGLFRSEDAGKTWSKVNEDHEIRQRAWYYTHIFADPKDPDLLYLLNVGFYKSIDGGKTLKRVSVPHGDNHDLWINTVDPKIMITGDDGGAAVSYNGGQQWTEENVPTAQFYHVVVDSQFPFKVYGAQQDNSTIAIPSRTTGFGIGKSDWYGVGGGESGFVTPDWQDPEIVYAGSYDGLLTRYDHRTDQQQDISVWPDNPMGAGAEGTKYRFQWTYPIVVSKYDPKVLYATANVVFKSSNEGMSWEKISPDISRNDTSKFHAAGGPITKDNTSVEYYGTIFAFSESKVRSDVLWAGTDDGLVHVTTDNGAGWSDVTPHDLPSWSMMSIIDASPFEAGAAYIAANRYKLDDFKPYLFKTTDFGKSWKKIVNGIPENEFTHVIRADPNRAGLLYAGTERGLYVSFDDGDNWQPLQMNLPVTPIHDIAIQARDKALVVATHGRSFWVLDDLSPIYQMNDDIVKSDYYLYKPGDTYRVFGFSFDRPGLAIGKNPPNGSVIYYYFKHTPREKDSVRLAFYDEDGKLIKKFNGKPSVTDESPDKEDGDNTDVEYFPADSGLNRFIWDMHYPKATDVKGAIFWGGTTEGPLGIPGKYQVRLISGKDSMSQEFVIKKDPRVQTSPSDFKEQFDFLIKIRDKISEAHLAVNTIRDIRRQSNDLVSRLDKNPSKKIIQDSAKSLNDKLSKIENEIIQTKLKSGEDALNYPIKLNNKIAVIADVVSSADTKPTRQSYDVFNELSEKLDKQLTKYNKILTDDIPAFEMLVKNLNIPVIILKPADKK